MEFESRSSPVRNHGQPPIDLAADPEKFAARVLLNQQELRSNLRSRYDFIVCGSGSSGSVVARRLAENADVSVLLIEAGGEDELPSVTDVEKWPANLGSERDWGFMSQPGEHVNGRSIALSMGKVLGGGSSINVMIRARGHRSDWDFFAAEANDSGWGYDAVLEIFRRIEDWHGTPDPEFRGSGGLVWVEPPANPNPVAPAMVAGAASIGIPSFDSHNGRMMESGGGASLIDMRTRAGRRQSVFRSYVYPWMDRPNLTVITRAHVNRVTFDGNRATGVEICWAGKNMQIQAAREVVLSMGAVQTPKVLMVSGVGNEDDLRRNNVRVVHHLPEVGQNFQDHVGFDCVWEFRDPLPPANTMVEATFFWKSAPGLESPDLQACQGEFSKASSENARLFDLPAAGWTLFGGVVRPKSRGSVHLTGPNPQDPVRIDANFLSHPDDLKAAVACVDLCREVGNSLALRPFVKREAMPGNLKGAALEDFVRNAASTYWHQAGTCRMGTDSRAVVDGKLKVHGLEGLRIADASIMPRVTTGNTQAPCVIIGERAAACMRAEHALR